MTDDTYMQQIEEVVGRMPVEATVERLPVPADHDPAIVALYRITEGERSHELFVSLVDWDEDPTLRQHQEIAFRTSIAAGIWHDLMDDPVPEPPSA